MDVWSGSAWTAARDDEFFRVVQLLFAPMWLAGATVLLSSYDAED
jgi:hypothetical protein